VQLITGQRLTRDAFLARWEQNPDLKHAELIDGLVHIPQPADSSYIRFSRRIITWLTMYADHTPGCSSGNNATWLMLESSPQPDSFLGRNVAPTQGKFCSGAPELAVEICVTSTEVDFGPKLALYQRAGVQEYITIETLLPKIIWRELIDGSYQPIAPGADGIYRSHEFPGLWLDSGAFWADDGLRLTATLQAGIDSRA